MHTPHWQADHPLLQPLLQTPRLGLITDVDGTISPIVDDPAAAAVTPRNRDLLAALVGQLALVAVVSGRSAADVRARVGLPDLVYVGNHGLERWQSGHVALAPEAAAYRPALEMALARLNTLEIPGMQVEDKGATVSVHYRRTPDPVAAAQRLSPALERFTAEAGLRLFQGRMVFELRPPIDVHKGTALRALVSEHGLTGALYLGDDTTDIDALVMARQLRESGDCYGLGLSVASEGTPFPVLEAGDLIVPGVSGVEAFFAWLLTARSASTS